MRLTLEEFVCWCYRIVKVVFDRLLGAVLQELF